MPRALLIASIILVAPACSTARLDGGGDSDPSDLANGRALYSQHCAACHGSAARGDGPAAAGLPTTPPDLTQLSARNGGTFDHDYVMSTIYAPSTGGTGAMPAFAHQDLGDLIIVEKDGLGTPVFTDLLAISNYLESLQSPAAGET